MIMCTIKYIGKFKLIQRTRKRAHVRDYHNRGTCDFFLDWQPPIYVRTWFRNFYVLKYISEYVRPRLFRSQEFWERASEACSFFWKGFRKCMLRWYSYSNVHKSGAVSIVRVRGLVYCTFVSWATKSSVIFFLELAMVTFPYCHLYLPMETLRL